MKACPRLPVEMKRMVGLVQLMVGLKAAVAAELAMKEEEKVKQARG